MNRLRSKLEQNLGWAVLLALAVGCLIVLRPFVSALLWAIVLSVSSWPFYRRLVRWVGNRRSLAAVLMTLAMVLVLVLPFVIVGATLADNVKDLTAAARKWVDRGPPLPPAWLAKVPMVGQQAAAYWQSLAQDTAKLWSEAERFIQPVSAWVLKVSLALGAGLLELVLSVFIAFFLFRDGVFVGQRLTASVERIGGDRGLYLLAVAVKTIRGVVYGILGTALAQAVMAGILRLGRASRRHGPGLAAGRHLALYPGLDGLGHLHAHLGPGGREPRQHRQTLAHQPGQRNALRADLLWRGGWGAGLRVHRRLSGAYAPGGRVPAGGGMVCQPGRRTRSGQAIPKGTSQPSRGLIDLNSPDVLSVDAQVT
jgi:hypothetical protein